MRPFAVMLALVICPGVAEATEDLAHLWSEGHTVHMTDADHAHDHDTDHEADLDQQHHDARHDDDEHGCSPLFHLCGCHSPSASMTSAALTFAHADAIHRTPHVLFASDDRRPSDDVVGEAFRPPIG